MFAKCNKLKKMSTKFQMLVSSFSIALTHSAGSIRKINKRTGRIQKLRKNLNDAWTKRLRLILSHPIAVSIFFCPQPFCKLSPSLSSVTCWKARISFANFFSSLIFVYFLFMYLSCVLCVVIIPIDSIIMSTHTGRNFCTMLCPRDS